MVDWWGRQPVSMLMSKQTHFAVVSQQIWDYLPNPGSKDVTWYNVCHECGGKVKDNLLLFHLSFQMLATRFDVSISSGGRLRYLWYKPRIHQVLKSTLTYPPRQRHPAPNIKAGQAHLRTGASSGTFYGPSFIRSLFSTKIIRGHKKLPDFWPSLSENIFSKRINEVFINCIKCKNSCCQSFLKQIVRPKLTDWTKAIRSLKPGTNT